MESAQILLVLLFATIAARSYHEHMSEMKKATRQIGSQNNVNAIDFSRVYIHYNPIHKTMLKAGIMLSVIKLAMRVRYDVFYGAPSGAAEIITMIVYYFFDIFVCVIFYAICWLFLSKLCARHNDIKDL
jgi:hypothetical protein